MTYDARQKVSNETIRNVLEKINCFVRKYHGNIVEFRTGKNPTNVNELGLEDSIHFLKHVWGLCLEWGNQSINSIGSSVQQLTEFLDLFKSKKEIHDLHTFLEKLVEYPKLKFRKSTRSDDVARLTELLPRFDSARIKTAALIMRFLCLDSNFFEVDKTKLIPPLDRVNYRMCKHLLGEEDTLKKLGGYKTSFDKEATEAFEDLGKEILNENKVLIDNLWFVGHFYHDGTDCKLRDAAKILAHPYLKNISLPTLCPFAAYGCERSRARNR